MNSTEGTQIRTEMIEVNGLTFEMLTCNSGNSLAVAYMVFPRWP